MLSSDSSTATPSPALARALRAALRPLVKVMLAQGVTLGYLTELIKSLMVDVAQTDFPLEHKAPTDSRISLMTGVHRKDVSRLREQLKTNTDHTPRAVSLGAQVVAVWVGSPQYLDPQGEPLPLPRFASEGGELCQPLLTVYSFVSSSRVLDFLSRDIGVISRPKLKRLPIFARFTRFGFLPHFIEVIMASRRSDKPRYRHAISRWRATR